MILDTALSIAASATAVTVALFFTKWAIRMREKDKIELMIFDQRFRHLTEQMNKGFPGVAVPSSTFTTAISYWNTDLDSLSSYEAEEQDNCTPSEDVRGVDQGSQEAEGARGPA